MIPITEDELFGNRKLHTRCTVALSKHDDRAVEIIKRDMAKMLAMKIVESENFFNTRAYTVAGVSYLDYVVDCFVLTADELRYLQQRAFQKGIEHAHGFMPFKE